MKSPLPFLASLLFAFAGPPASGGTVERIAGIGEKGSDGDGGSALQARLDSPFGIVRGPDGALWFADYDAHRIRRIDGGGGITTVAGNGRGAYAGDGGPAREASLNHPHELRFDAHGDLFIADTSNHVIRRLNPKSGILTTWAGTGHAGYSGDGGPATAAKLRDPISLQFAPNGDLYIAEVGNHVIRRVDGRTRRIETLVGTGRPGATPDGVGFAGATVQGPRSLDFDRAGNLWLATREGNQVFRLDFRERVIRHHAGTGQKGFAGDGGPARAALLAGPKGIAVAPNGDVYLADTENHAIRRLDPARGTIDRVVGTGTSGAADPPEEPLLDDPRKVRLARPHGVFVDADGTLLIGDSERHRILAVRGIDPGAKP